MLAERTQTDAELRKTRVSVEQDADRVVEVARDRAEATLRAARDRADRDMTTAGVATELRKEIEVERAAEDGAVADEHAAADGVLAEEREARERALTALLRHERDATDDGLLVERARADEAVATRDDFLAIVSHDLRNMLGGIAVSAAMLAKFLTTEGDHGTATLKHAERIQRFTARMNRLVGDLIDVVSLEAGKLHVTTRPADAIQLMKEAAEAFQHSFAVKGITLTTAVASEAILAECDHERIIQVLANLLSNALKFTDSGGTVTLSVASTGAQVTFCVTDTGVGIPAEDKLIIFERFRQLSPKDRRGLGLGLYIAKCIVESHGGTIWAETPEAGGTALYFTLPKPGRTASPARS